MLDLALIGILGWTAFLGHAMGGFRALVRLSGLVGALYTIDVTSPWLRFVAMNGAAARSFNAWLQRLMDPVLPAWMQGSMRTTWLALASGGRGMSSLFLAARHTYLRVQILGYGLAVAFGFMMALRTFETVWPNDVRRASSGWIGALFGLASGLFLMGMMLRAMALWHWYHDWQPVRTLMYGSVIAHAWTVLRAHAIL